MCIIAFKKKGLPVWDDATVTEMFSRNPDGAGLMWVEKKENDVHPWVYIKKGFMTLPPLLDFLHQRDWADIPLVLHCRIGTSGGKTPLNCHPYPLYEQNFTEGKCHAAMAHNGVFRRYTPDHDAGINDTQVFIHEVVEALPNNLLDDKRLMDIIEALSEGSRLCFMREDGKVSLTGNWVKDGGYYYSNTSYKPYDYRAWEQPYSYKHEAMQMPLDDEDDEFYEFTEESELDDLFSDMNIDGTVQICCWDGDDMLQESVEDYLCDNFSYDPESMSFSSESSKWIYVPDGARCVRWRAEEKAE